MAKIVSMLGLASFPLIQAGDNIGQTLVKTVSMEKLPIEEGDIFVLAQKIVSISENAIVDLNTVSPSEKAISISKKTGRDARLCQVYLNESRHIIDIKGRMVITRHRLGFECSGAGVDRSNVAPHSENKVVLLPKNPDLSAMRIRKEIFRHTGKNVAVIINDSFGRADREGSVGIAIGISGIKHLDKREQKDLYGNPRKSQIALIDELAAAASILMGQADEKIPAVLIKGVQYQRSEISRIQDILCYKMKEEKQYQ